MTRSIHRRLSALVALVLAATMLPATLAAADTVTTEDPAEAAAGWLVGALTDDPAVGSEFGPSTGPTIDVLFALAAVGVAADTQVAITDWLTTQVGPYTRGEGFDADDATYAGATAKLILALEVADRDPRDAAGDDLVPQLLGREVTDEADGLVGRFTDTGDFGDFSTPLTQSLAVLALHRADGVDPSPAAVAALADSACPDGGIPSSFDAAADPETCTSSVDTTGFAVQALLAVGETAAADEAVSWLAVTQADDGSFASAEGVNSNSTGLAAAAFSLRGQDAAAEAARDWILGIQDGPDSDSPGAIPFNTDDRGLVELATSQAILGLVGADLATLSSSGSSTDVPVFAPVEAPVDAPVDDADGTDEVEQVEESDDEREAVADDGRETPQPTGVDAGTSPSTDWLLVASLLLGGLLLALGLGLRLQLVRSRD